VCGIGGILRTDGEPIPDEWLDAIDARIAYRGPDGAGRFRDRVEFVDENGRKRVVEVALVHRRMAIIDLEDGGQPMVSERGRDDSEGLIAVVFNGCIYNHRELRKELESRGHVFVTDHSDTEVLIHGWREWGMRLHDEIIGMYSFGLWDRSHMTLAIGRDRFQKKPLWYKETEWTNPRERRALVAFSSEVTALEEIQINALDVQDGGDLPFHVEYLQLGYSREHGLSRSITRTDLKNLGGDTWWRFGTFRAASKRNSDFFFGPIEFADKPATYEQLIERAVARRLEADVPLGCFLSGGVDSSLIAHFAKKHKDDLMTFSVRMPDARYDESEHAERVAKHLGTDHHALEVSMNPAEDLVHLIDLLGQPFGDSSILPTYWVSKAAREHVKVALSGDGGDELFIGYERYLAAPILAKHDKLLAKIPSAVLRKAHPKSKIAKFARLGDMARDYPHIGISAMESIFTQAQIAELTNLPSPSGRGAGGEGEWFDAIAALRDFDLHNYLPYDLLRKVDTASMAVALEVRCPFLDRDLASAVLATPIEELIPNGERKGLLKQIARKHLPKDAIDRPKMGFAIPIGEWFRSDFGGMRTLLLDHLNSADPFGPIELNRKAVQRFVDEHLSGRADHSHRLFTLLTLSIWARHAQCSASP